MTNTDKVRAFLSRNAGLWFCDSCISNGTGIRTANQVNQLARPLACPCSPFCRSEGTTCSKCGEMRLCTKAVIPGAAKDNRAS